MRARSGPRMMCFSSKGNTITRDSKIWSWPLHIGAICDFFFKKKNCKVFHRTNLHGILVFWTNHVLLYNQENSKLAQRARCMQKTMVFVVTQHVIALRNQSTRQGTATQSASVQRAAGCGCARVRVRVYKYYPWGDD